MVLSTAPPEVHEAPVNKAGIERDRPVIFLDIYGGTSADSSVDR